MKIQSKSRSWRVGIFPISCLNYGRDCIVPAAPPAALSQAGTVALTPAFKNDKNERTRLYCSSFRRGDCSYRGVVFESEVVWKREDVRDKKYMAKRQERGEKKGEKILMQGGQEEGERNCHISAVMGKRRLR